MYCYNIQCYLPKYRGSVRFNFTWKPLPFYEKTDYWLSELCPPQTWVGCFIQWVVVHACERMKNQTAACFSVALHISVILDYQGDELVEGPCDLKVKSEQLMDLLQVMFLHA